MTASPHEAQPAPFPVASGEIDATQQEFQLRQNLWDACLTVFPIETTLEHLNYTGRLIEATAALQATPENQRRVEVAGDYLKWKAFPHLPVPPSVHLYHDRQDGKDIVHIGIDPQEGVTTADALHLAGELMKAPDAERISTERAAGVMNDEKVKNAAWAYLEAMPAYRFLVSFGQQVSDRHEAPLLPHERLVREVALEQEVRRRYGLDAHEMMLRHSTAGKELGRKLGWLDNETLPKPKDMERDELASFRRFVIDAFAQHLRETSGEELVDIRYQQSTYNDPLQLVFADPAGAEKIEKDIHRLATYEMASVLLELIGVQSEFKDDLPSHLQYRMLYEALLFAFSGSEKVDDGEVLRTVPRTHASVLRQVSHNTVFDLLQYVASSMRLVTDHHALGDLGDVAAWLHGMGLQDAEPWPDPMLRRPEAGALDLRGYTYDRQDPIMSREQYRRQEQHTAGWVRRHGKGREDSVERLITFERSRSRISLPQHVKESDLDVVLGIVRPRYDQLPYIGGYELVGYNLDKNLYSFVKTEEDMYERPPLPPFGRGAVHALSVEYEKMGLLDLAKELENREHTLDAYQLETLVAAYSDYSFDADSKVLPKITALRDFEQQVKNGRLQVQCTGSAQFLIKSLDIIMHNLGGLDLADMMSGMALPTGKDERILMLGHAKVLAYLFGHRVVLDATPASREVSSPVRNRFLAVALQRGSGGERGRRQSQSLARKVAKKALSASRNSMPEARPVVEKPAHPAVTEAAITALREELAESRRPEVSTIKTRLEHIAQVAVDTRGHQKLYEKLQQLPHGDPLRATLQLVLQDEITDEMVAARLASLAAYAQAKPENIKRAGLKQYDPKLIQELLTLTHELGRARR